jgi:hypothetical protein
MSAMRDAARVAQASREEHVMIPALIVQSDELEKLRTKN